MSLRGVASEAREGGRPDLGVWLSALNTKQLHGSEVSWGFSKADLGWFPCPPRAWVSSDAGPLGDTRKQPCLKHASRDFLPYPQSGFVNS